MIRELPAQQNVGVQAVVDAWDAATGAAVAATCEAATQTESGDPDPESTNSSTEDWGGLACFAGVAGASHRAAQPRESGTAGRMLELWFPASPGARMSPWEDRELRCGTRGYTVKTCPYCRPG